LYQHNIPFLQNQRSISCFDEAGLLSKQEKDALNNKLIKFADSTSTEIEVVIIKSTKGEDVNFLATMFGEQWKIGKKEWTTELFSLLLRKTEQCLSSREEL
jgi:uncharacterized membrane protein YgcG